MKTFKFKKYFLYFYLSLVGVSLFLMAFAITFSGLKYFNSNDLSPVSLSSPEALRRTIDNYIPKPYVVYSGSMEPTIKTASLIFTLPTGNYDKGDIITFKKTGSKETITHRIEAITYVQGTDPRYITSGDANEDIDQGSINKDQIIGKVFLHVPYVGHAVDFAKTPQGFILLVIVPATIIIYEELKNLLVFIRGLFNKKHHDSKISESNNKKTIRLPKISIAIPFIGVFMVFLGLSVSFFYDKEDSVDNILAVGTFDITPSPTPDPSVTPTPTPSDNIADVLVINEVMPDTECFQGNTEAQWIEIYNGYPFEVDLKNFKIWDGVLSEPIDLVNAVTLVPSGSLALLSHNSAIWNNCWDDNGAITVNLGGQLDIDVEFLQLYDTNDNIIDTVKWGSQTTGLDIGLEESIERDPDGFDTVDTTNFEPTDFTIRPTPQPGL